MAEDRGTAFVRNLLQSDIKLRVLCAGWPADDSSHQLLKHPAVTNLGVIRQAEANQIIAREVDFILAIYPDGNLNNYYASPNKLYDAIHCQTPLVIGDNVKVSEFVSQHNLGLVINKAARKDPSQLGTLLLEKRSSYNIDPALIDRYCWENYEPTLIGLHQGKQ